MTNAYRPRRTCLSVPGSSQKMIDKAKGLPADEVFLDLEDAVAPDAKAAARTRVAAAIAEPGWAGQLRGVRVNDWTTPWTHADIIEVVSTVGAAPDAKLDVVVLPKVSDVSHVQALDLLLTQLETVHGLPVGEIGIDAQIEDARGLMSVDAIAAEPRVQALVLGPADLMASLNMRTLVVGEQPEGYDVGDAYHHALMTILVAARAHGIAAVDGPYLKVRDVAAFRRVAGRSAALGYDGKWVLHPDQIAAGNEIFSPRQEEYDHAELILEAYEWHTSAAGGARGAVMLGDEMIDEASRKMALVIAAKGRAAGIQRQSGPFVPDQSGRASGSDASEGSPQRRGGERRHEGNHEYDHQHRRSRADCNPSDGKPAALLACSLDLIERHRPEHDADDGNRDCENVQQNAEHDTRDRGDHRPDGQPIGLV